jgi:geranylgeranyl diphosphate synthase type II
MFSGNYRQAIPAALGIEIFHNFTLLHDDIMDNALLRRNSPTVHTKWDNNVAILSGDAMQIIAIQHLRRTGSQNMLEIIDTFNETALKVCEGQQFDMDFESLSTVTVDEYLNMIGLKTAELLAASLKIGALIGNAPGRDIQNIYAFGKNLGLAFQLQDDFLDVYAKEDELGKEIGKDIKANKKTFLLLKTMELAENADLQVINGLLGKKDDQDGTKVQAMTSMYEKYQIPYYTKHLIEEYFTKAMENLHDIELAQLRKEEMMKIINMLKIRNS